MSTRCADDSTAAASGTHGLHSADKNSPTASPAHHAATPPFAAHQLEPAQQFGHPPSPPPHVLAAVADTLLSASATCAQSQLLPAGAFQQPFVIRRHQHPGRRSAFTHFSPSCIAAAHGYTQRNRSEDDCMTAEKEKSVRTRRRERRQQCVADDSASPVASLAHSWASLIRQRAQAVISSSELPELNGWDVTLHVPAQQDRTGRLGYIDIRIVAVSSLPSLPSPPPPLPPAVPAGSVSTAYSSTSSFTFSPIGYLSSCFKLKFATPRQGSIASSSRASLTLLPHIPSCSLQGLSAYSHCWLLSVFHHNGSRQTVSPLVRPPRLDGEKLGVFASRSPHRFNPIGLSLVRIESVELQRGCVCFSSVDLVDGTPILDLKPYHPADAPPAASALLLPDYVSLPHASLSVSILPSVSAALSGWLGQLERRWAGAEELERLIVEMVSCDPRPVFLRRKAEGRAAVFGMRLDWLNVLYHVDDQRRHAEVCEVEWVGDAAATEEEEQQQSGCVDERQRTKRWLASVGRTGRRRDLSAVIAAAANAG